MDLNDNTKKAMIGVVAGATTALMVAGLIYRKKKQMEGENLQDIYDDYLDDNCDCTGDATDCCCNGTCVCHQESTVDTEE